MNQNINYRGVFWVPEEPIKQLYGSLSFESAKLSYYFLDSWVGYSSFTPKIEKGSPVGVVTNSDALPITTLFSNSEYSISIDYSTSYPLDKGRKKYNLDQLIYLNLKLNKEVSFEEFNNINNRIKRFLFW